MSHGTFLLDTNIVSMSSKPRPHPRLVDWLFENEDVIIPFPVFIEISRGIAELATRDPHRASSLKFWLEALLKTKRRHLKIGDNVALKLGEMMACKQLRQLWVVPSTARRVVPGQDLTIAAISIVHRIPIATLDTFDFVLIDKYFKLPGVYDPVEDEWAVSRTVTPASGLSRSKAVRISAKLSAL